MRQHPSDPTSPPSGGERQGTFDGIFGGTGSAAGVHLAEGQIDEGRRRTRGDELIAMLFFSGRGSLFGHDFWRCVLISAPLTFILGENRACGSWRGCSCRFCGVQRRLCAEILVRVCVRCFVQRVKV